MTSRHADGVVIVGASHAGVTLASSLREGGFDGRIRLIGAEPHLPYQRPPLSKALLAGAIDESALMLRAEAFYRDSRIELVLGRRVQKLDTRDGRLELDDGSVLAFDRLALATGTRSRPFLGGRTLPDGVLACRTLDDARRLKQQIAIADRVVIVGGGYIGLEIASTLAHAGRSSVTVVEAGPRLGGRGLSPMLSRVLHRLHSERGTRVLCGRSIAGLIEHAGRVTGVSLSDGEILGADLVVLGVGVLPETGLAQDAGLACDDGILIDPAGVTSCVAVSALGDCSAQTSRFAGGRLRLECIQNAGDQARTLAATYLGRPRPHDVVPWFWTEQLGLRIQTAGLLDGVDRSVLRGDEAGARFSIYHYRAGRLRAVETVNLPGEHMLARRVLAEGGGPSPEQAGDTGFDLKSIGR